MNEPQAKPKTIPEQLREIIEATTKEFEAAQQKADNLKEELKRLNKALKQWEPKE